ncbi:DNA-binding GntR family transcriptional regulator [Catenulispora sp. GAS73]
MREALTRLSEQRLVRSEPQLGFSVPPLDRAGLEDLTAVRVEIETLALRWAIEPGDQNGISEAWSDAHSAFHTALASGCGSPLLMELRCGPYDSAAIYRRWARPGAVREERDVHKEHTDIADAAIARDVGLATSLLEAHIRQTTKTLLTSDLMNSMNSTPD